MRAFPKCQNNRERGVPEMSVWLFFAANPLSIYNLNAFKKTFRERYEERAKNT